MALFRRRPKVFYGWVVVAISFTTLLINYSISHAFSVFYVAILKDFGWTRADTALAYTVNRLVNGGSAPFVGTLIDRIGPRRLLPLGAVVMAIGLLATSQMNSIWQYILFYGTLCAIGTTSMGVVPNMTVLSNWFVRLRGTAAGFATAGIGVGMFLITPLAAFVIANWGWRAGYQVLAMIVLAVVPTLTALFQRHRPQDMGLLPDGVAAGDNASIAAAAKAQDELVVDREWAAREWTVGRAIRTRRFWLVTIAMGTAVMSTQTWLVHQTALITDAGYDLVLGSIIFAIVGIFGSAGKIIWGTVSDYIGREMSNTIGSVCTLAGILMLALIKDTSQPWMLYAFAVLFGIGYGTHAPIHPAITADIFQGKNFGAIWGVVFVGTGAGTAFGPWLAGYIFDRTESYDGTVLFTSVSLVVSVVFFWLAAPRKVRLASGQAKRAPRPAVAGR